MLTVALLLTSLAQAALGLEAGYRLSLRPSTRMARLYALLVTILLMITYYLAQWVAYAEGR